MRSNLRPRHRLTHGLPFLVNVLLDQVPVSFKVICNLLVVFGDLLPPSEHTLEALDLFLLLTHVWRQALVAHVVCEARREGDVWM